MRELLLNPGLLAILAIVAVALYMFITLRLVRRKASLLWIPALLVALLATILYWNAYGVTGMDNWFPRLVMSITTALDLFLFKAFCSLGIAPFFFRGANATIAEGCLLDSHLILLYGLFICAIWTTSILIVHLLARRFASRLWLLTHGKCKGRTHIFIGDSRQALVLASGLDRKEDNQVLFVVFPTQETVPAKVSLLQLFKGFSAGTEKLRDIKAMVPGAIILHASKSIKSCQGTDFFREIGLARLAGRLRNPQTSVYLLSDALADNMYVLQHLPECPAQIFCRTGSSGLNDSLELVSNLNVHLVDRSLMTKKQLMTEPSFHPVRFVRRAMDAQGQPLGWVEKGFRSLVLGFGETGRGAVDFLYEFGAFVGKDKRQVPFLCEIIDRDAAALSGSFNLEHGGIPEGRIRFLSMEIGSDDFWGHFSEALPELNYIVVSLGDDNLNVRLAIDMLETICRDGHPALPAIVVRLEEPDKYRKIIDFHQESLSVDCIRILSGMSMWTMENLIDETFEQYARTFYDGYRKTTGDTTSWTMRHDAIYATEKSLFWKKREYRRKTGQDYSDFLHMRVKAELCPETFIKDPAVASSIPDTYEGTHCTGPAVSPVLEYLAIGEHLRWQAAHEIAGYRKGPEKREDLKIHPALQEYSSLSEIVRHYDWIVVKTTLKLLGSGNNSPE